jgi:hypothetical protein
VDNYADILERIKVQKESGLELIGLFRDAAGLIDEGDTHGVNMARFIFLHLAQGSPTALAKALRNLATGLETDPAVTR